MKRIILTLIMSLVLLSNVWADGVEVDLIEGGTVIPVQNDNIRMVSEEVRMFGDVKVIANFVFENLSNKPAAIKMGFPVPSAKNFKAWIQGQSVKVDKRLMGGKNEIVLKDSGGFTPEMYVWDISFSAREKKNVKVEYNGEWAVPIDGHPYTYYIYITKTGALWSGTIGKADFYMELTERLMRLLTDKKFNFKLSIKPEGYVIKDSETEGYVVKNGLIEWHFTNWKPTENIGVALVEDEEANKSFLQILRASGEIKASTNEKTLTEQKTILKCIEYFKNKEYEGNQRYYTVADSEKWKELTFADGEALQRLYIKALRNEMYARHGRIFTTPEMKQIFESLPWYKPRPDFKEAELNEIEKKNVEFILEYEKKMGWK